ncbi:signal recognition particle, SRP9/SRP14 subunit [Sporormia fimetaria CBS 119925]|uniref:Signal recognition particle subunit SRP14 n=1 Tax=Sporormia fimetaria CBS 119925 TaxID=1340428 RepID=A0A6A6VBI4_9PLEO|nr:signal recognition particle, SRP9/SRP14 subunit [Sporormia fimetaria CBS 119925]
MAGDHLTNDEFFTQLANLFELNQKKGHGSIHLTQKRLAYGNVQPPTDAQTLEDPLWDTYHPEEPVPVLIRATNNKSTKRAGTDRENVDKVKISTVVQPDQIDAFYARYAEACKAGMSGLKKRDRKKGKKDKKKKKGTSAEAKV